MTMKRLPFAVFTAVFAALAVFVFWGTWSPDFAPVMPDDRIWHPVAYADQLAEAWRGWLDTGVLTPLQPLWNGLLPRYETQELKYAAGLYASALALAYFLRGRGLSRLASYGAGLFLGFCGYWCTLFSAGHAMWFVLMAYAVSAVAFLDRAIVGDRWRHWILFGASVGWCCCQQQDIFILFFLFFLAYGAYACIRERRFPWRGALVAPVVCLIVGGAGIRQAFTSSLAARQGQIKDLQRAVSDGGRDAATDPAAAAARKKAEDEVRWIFVTNWSLPPEDTLEFFVSRIHGDTSCPMTLQLGRAAGKDVRPYTGRLGRPVTASRGNYRQHSLYVGWVTCLLALFALVARAVRRGGKSPAPGATADVVFFAAAAVVFWLCSMGRFCEPVYRIVYQLPFGDSLRAPVKWHHVTELCLCVLAGFGLEGLLRLLSEKFNPKAARAIVGALVLVGAADLARNDRLFCAPIDLRMVRGRNAAAEEVRRCGAGAVCDLIEGARGLVSWSFNAHLVSTTSDPAAPGVRFALVGTDQANRNPQLANWLRQTTTPLGTYCLTHGGIRAAAANASNVALYRMNGVPPPPASESPPVSGAVLALGILSLLGTVSVGVCLWRLK